MNRRIFTSLCFFIVFNSFAGIKDSVKLKPLAEVEFSFGSTLPEKVSGVNDYTLRNTYLFAFGGNMGIPLKLAQLSLLIGGRIGNGSFTVYENNKVYKYRNKYQYSYVAADAILRYTHALSKKNALCLSIGAGPKYDFYNNSKFAKGGEFGLYAEADAGYKFERYFVGLRGTYSTQNYHYVYDGPNQFNFNKYCLYGLQFMFRMNVSPEGKCRYCRTIMK